VEKSQAELGLGFNPKGKEALKDITIGINRRLFEYFGIDVALGVQGTLSFIPENIAFIYGEQTQRSFEIYLSIHPKLLEM